MDKLHEKAYLLVNIIDKEGRNTKVQGQIYDISNDPENKNTFEIAVPSWKVHKMTTDARKGWLEVDFLGEEVETVGENEEEKKVSKRKFISLPAPIIDKGHNITVHSDLVVDRI